MNKARRQRGQSLVEAALILPVLLLLLVGVVDLGRAMSAKIALTNASREGARYASRYPNKKSNIIAAVGAELDANGLGIDSDDVVIGIVPDPSGTPAAQGAKVTVTCTYPFETIMGGLLGVDSIEIRAATSMVVISVQN